MKDKIKHLIRQYNDTISPIRPYRLEFSQDSINAVFKSDSFGTGFPHAGKSIQEVGQMRPFPTQDFRIGAFLHPRKEGVLVIDNNRGGTAHAVAGVPMRIKIIDYEKAGNKQAFETRKSDGTTIQFDKNLDRIIGKTTVQMQENTRMYGRIPTGEHKILDE